MATWRRMIGSAASAVDRAVVAAMHARGARDRARAKGLGHQERLEALSAIAGSYGDDALYTDEGSFFPRPASAIDVTLKRVREGVWDAAWPSTSIPYLAAVSERYLSRIENRTARARLYLKNEPKEATKRPALIAIHGYMGGHWLLEEAQWPIPWMLRRGLDVALPILPQHALRGGARKGAPPFPSADPRMTNEGFRQAVADIVGLAMFLRDRGAPHVGVIGMSLGGYTSALLATVTDTLDFVMPMIPLASVADFAREQGQLGTGNEVAEQHAALERANWVVSPLARPLRIPKERAVVVAAEHDKITPVAHAARISDHFGCELITMPGGHLLQIGRTEAFRALARMLERAEIIAPRPSSSTR